MAWNIFRRAQADKISETKKPETWRDNVKTLAWAVVIALIIRSFFFQPFNIPSSSMKPTLLIGDFLFVSKFSYGYSRHSLPFSPPIMDGRIMAGAPERGDVVVFKLPADNRTDFIKRVIGLPGDTIQMRNGVVILNGQAVPREAVENFTEAGRDGGQKTFRRYRETLPNGRSYFVLDEVENGPADNTGLYRVPAGHYFMMGDNRDNSADSRVTRYVGYVPHENLVGPAQILFFSFDDMTPVWKIWQWPNAIRYSRLLNWVE
jgi:signal peptidase I